MPYSPIWKYCTAAHCADFLLSLRLLGDTAWTAERQLDCLYAVANHTARHYRPAAIAKRDGGLRMLEIPDPLLKTLQRNILHHVLDGLSVSPSATAYVRGRDIVDNALPHVGRQTVLKLDIEDFFGSITFAMVYSMAFPGVYFPPPVRTLLTNLCCHRGRLPQGAPTSAAISNRILEPFDTHMAAWCQARGIRYTRYCDDMTFSGDFAAKEVIAKAASFLGALGFVLNKKKTRVYTQPCRQHVTGVVVNEKPQATRAYRDALRQEAYYCRRYGVASHLARKGMASDDAAARRYLRSILGKVNHVLHLNPADSYFRAEKARLAALLAEMDGRTPHK